MRWQKPTATVAIYVFIYRYVTESQKGGAECRVIYFIDEFLFRCVTATTKARICRR